MFKIKCGCLGIGGGGGFSLIQTPVEPVGGIAHKGVVPPPLNPALHGGSPTMTEGRSLKLRAQTERQIGGGLLAPLARPWEEGGACGPAASDQCESHQIQPRPLLHTLADLWRDCQSFFGMNIEEGRDWECLGRKCSVPPNSQNSLG